MPTHTKKAGTSYRLSDRARESIRRFADRHGITDSAAVEMAVLALDRVSLEIPPSVVVDLLESCPRVEGERRGRRRKAATASPRKRKDGTS
jgi:hypothetical protein